MQNITFNSNQRLNNIIRQPGIDKTTLTEWMEINKYDTNARELTYTEFPIKYVWNNKYKYWSPRQMGHTIGRTFHVHPSSGELYYLKLLLNHQKGATSYEALRTVNDIIYPTNQTACYALGLLGDDREWDESIQEASFWSTATQLRQLFVVILLFCNVNNPIKFLEKHWKLMTDDILYKIKTLFNNPNFQVPEAELYNFVLYELEKILNTNSSTLTHFNLPLPTGSLIDDLNNKFLREELDYDIHKLKEENIKLVNNLNNEQQFIYQQILQSLHEKKNNLFFIYGHGGTGKTYLWNAIITKIRSNNEIILAVASSGIASLLLPKGRTAHSRFRIPLSIDKFSTCHIKKGTQLAKLIDKTSLILWDEAPMTNKYCFEALDKTLQDLRNNFEQPFGGMTIVLGGDFQQILPVIPTGTKKDIINATINNSYLWPYFKILKLTENMRLKRYNHREEEKNEIVTFSKWILNVGDGIAEGIKDLENEDAKWVKIPKKYILHYESNPIEKISSLVYDNLNIYFNNIEYLKERAIITPRNKTADEINNYILSLIPEQEKCYYSYDTIASSSENIDELNLLYPQEFLHTLNFNGIPPHELKLKLGTPIMLLRNLNQSNGLCNGTRLIITQLTNKIIEGQIINSSNINEKVYIPRIEMTVHESK